MNNPTPCPPLRKNRGASQRNGGKAFFCYQAHRRMFQTEITEFMLSPMPLYS